MKRRRESLFQFSLRGLDTNLLIVLFFVMVFGFIMIYSASYYIAGLSKAYNNDSMYLLRSQVIYSLLGVVAMFVVSCINYHFWSLFIVPGYLVCVGRDKMASFWVTTVSGGRANQVNYDCFFGDLDCLWTEKA